MFKSLKEKLKGWISKTKEETEEEVVETKKEEVTKKEEKKVKESKKVEKKEKTTEKKPKEEVKEEKPEEKPEKDKPEVKETKEKKPKEEVKEESKEVSKEIKEEKLEEVEEKVPEEKEEKKGFFSGFFKSKKEEKPKEEIKEESKEVSEEIKEEKLEEVEEKVPEEKEEVKEKKKSSFSLFKRKSLTEEKFDELFDELELILMQNNVAYSAIESIKESLKKKLVGENSTDVETSLKEAIEELLINPPDLVAQIKEKEEKPFVILFAGINGAGKTTTIAKVTNLLKKNNFSVCLASADTFRAAAIEQLQVHADRLEVPLIKKDYGADPASVGYDAIKYAKKNNIDCVLIDTAGRMNNRDSLMKEIEKISRVNNPDLKIFLGESITGNDATNQAKDFNDAIGIDGIILSKADVDEKGGTAISVAEVTKKPIYFLGTGQGYDNLDVFNKDDLIKKIFS